MTPIAPLIETFLRDTFACQRGASRHTRDSYASSFQLLFVFAADRLKVKPSALTLEQIDAGLVSAFLEHLEDERKNAAVTRNVRLAAIKSFFRFVEYRQPAALERRSAVYWRSRSRKLTRAWCPTFCAKSSKPCSTPRSGDPRWHPRSRNAARGRLRRAARLRADGPQGR
ncbi:site-specific integrase [Bradyrhizobium sp. 172]|uniref:site-specific integrase n=1 Tax=Bradyrhizobium sp. 172 TaxID=2782643 RepID=UPI003209AEF6